jgi:hypothetical protein
MKSNQHQDEANHVKELIKAYLDVDITTKSRKREIVQAKHVFVHILRSAKCTCVEVGRHMGMDYTSVLHYDRTFESYYNQSNILRDKYNRILDLYNEKYDPRLALTTCELREQLFEAQQLVKELSSKSKQQTEERASRNNILLHELIDARTTPDNEESIYIKMRAFYNGI